MAKVRKGFTGIKICRDGEVYRFKNGIAVVPGFLMSTVKYLSWCNKHVPVKITYKTFLEMNNGEDAI